MAVEEKQFLFRLIERGWKLRPMRPNQKSWLVSIRWHWSDASLIFKQLALNQALNKQYIIALQ